MNQYLSYLDKSAEEEKLLKPHQERVHNKMKDSSGVVVAHSMGSGKTLTALTAAQKAQEEHPDKHVTFIAPASLVSNVHKEIDKHGIKIDHDRFHVTTYDKAARNVNEHLSREHSLVIMDEGHKMRNKDTQRHQALKKVLAKSEKRMLLTGTPAYHKPSDIAVLVNQAAGKKVLPDEPGDFEAKFIGKREVKPGFIAKHVLGVKGGSVSYLKNQDELREHLKKYVDTYDAKHDAAENFPTSKHHVVHVEMDDKQEKLYRYMEGKLPAPVKWKVRMGLPMDKKESKSLNAFSTGVRQISNSVKPYLKDGETHELSPKLRTAVDRLHDRHKTDKNFKGLVYSNYLGAGLQDYSDELKKRGIKHGIYHGGLTQKEKDAMRDQYNDGDLKALLVSSSGAEGLDLKGTKLVQVLEPHFNKKKIDQVVGRGIRYGSHAHLPEKERHVDVEHYISTTKPSLLDKVIGSKSKSIDEYLHEHSNDKDKIMNEMMAMVKEQ